MNDRAPEPSNRASWLEKITQILLGEPRNRKELVRLLRDAQRRELLDADSLGMIEGVLHISEMRVGDIMIPKAQMAAIDRDASIDAIIPLMVDSAHSRFPVTGESSSEVIGILLAKDLLSWLAENKDAERFNIRQFLRPATFVPESKRLDVLLREFRQTRSHLAIVVDEYGGITGLVTIEDVLEQIVGDIADEHDVEEDEQAIMAHDDGHFSVKALTPIEDFNAYFNTDFSDETIDTVGGLLLQAFGRLPQRDESIELKGFMFTVVRADNRRLHLLHVSPIESTDET